MIKGLITAVRTLTIIKLPGRESSNLADSLFWFPLVGFFIGAILNLIIEIINFFGSFWAAGQAILILIFSVVLTGGIHLDGFADFADGFMGSREKEKILKIMKDPCIGAFGGIAIVLILFVKMVSITQLIALRLQIWIIPAFIVSRFVMVDLAVSLPYARKEGGTAEPFVKSATILHRNLALLITLILIFLVKGLSCILIFLFGWVIGRFLRKVFLSRVNGITGDLLGASSEIVETVIIFICAASGGFLERIF